MTGLAGERQNRKGTLAPACPEVIPSAARVVSGDYRRVRNLLEGVLAGFPRLKLHEVQDFPLSPQQEIVVPQEHARPLLEAPPGPRPLRRPRPPGGLRYVLPSTPGDRAEHLSGERHVAPQLLTVAERGDPGRQPPQKPPVDVAATGDGVVRLYPHTRASSQSLTSLADPRLPRSWVRPLENPSVNGYSPRGSGRSCCRSTTEQAG